MRENVEIQGTVTFELTGPDGQTKRSQHNMVMNAGLAWITGRLLGSGAAASHIAVGTGNTAVSAGQTTLVAEIDRVATGAGAQASTTISNDSVQYSATFGPGTATGTLKEAGLFNASVSGTMIARVQFSDYPKGALDTLVVTWKLKFAGA